MAIYYTTHEGTSIQKLHKTVKHGKIVRTLKKNRKLENGAYRSVLFGKKIASVFFTKNFMVKKIWDARTGKYRGKGVNYKYFDPRIPKGVL